MGSRSHIKRKNRLSVAGKTIAGRQRKGGRGPARSGNPDPDHHFLRQRFIAAHPGAVKSRAQIMGIGCLSNRELKRRSSFPFVSGT